jgi:hypothetical protein
MDHTFFAPLDSPLHQNETSTHHFLAVALKYFLTGLLFDDRGNSAGSSKRLVGAPGFEPGNGGIKIRCLTTWLRPNACERGNLLKFG